MSTHRHLYRRLGQYCYCWDEHGIVNVFLYSYHIETHWLLLVIVFNYLSVAVDQCVFIWRINNAVCIRHCVCS